MNHIYRLVWNFKLQAFVVASELARSRSKISGGGKSRPQLAGLLMGVSLVPWSLQALADVEAANSASFVYKAANGVEVIDIATANAQGLSHNKFNRYNVNPTGLVLNNNSPVTGPGPIQSQLAGQVMSNLNLNLAAKVILNEVVLANRSVMEGFTEVAGTSADVIVANPWGITCSGCGFINTDRVTLTTGTPNIVGGVIGGFSISQGDVLINGTGANLSDQQIFDVVARSIKIDGQVNANDLKMVAGTNDFNYSNRTATATAPDLSAPSYSIDSTMLGGMYANRIDLIATEAGVGVRMLGELAATAENFTLTSAGKIELLNTISAEKNIVVKSDDSVELTDAKLSSKDNIEITAANNINIAGGVMKADDNMSLAAGGTLTDTASSTAEADNNKRYAGNNVDIQSGGALDIANVAYGAANQLSINAESLSLATGATVLYTETGSIVLNAEQNITLNDASVVAAIGVSIDSVSGELSTSAGQDQGVKAKAGDINISTGNGVNNAGVLSADGVVNIKANNAIINDGTLYAKDGITITDKSGAASQNVTNNGVVLSDAAISIIANIFENAADLQGRTGTSITATSIENSGLLIASVDSSSSGTFTANTLNNSGMLQSAHNLTIALKNALENSGTLLAENNIGISGIDALTLLEVINYTNGIIQANNDLTLSGKLASDMAALVLEIDSYLLAQNQLTINVKNVNNSGILQAGVSSDIQVTDELTNNLNAELLLSSATGTGTVNAGAVSNAGVVYSAGDLMLEVAGTLNNMGIVQGDVSTAITADVIDNTGIIIASRTAGQSGTVNANTLNNSSVIKSAEDLTVNVLNSIQNSGDILAAKALTVRASDAGTTLNVSNKTDGDIQAGTVLTISGAAGTANATLSTESGSSILANTLDIDVNAINNGGVIQSNNAANIAVYGALVNQVGAEILLAQAGDAAIVYANGLNNAGVLQSTGDLLIEVENTFLNSGSTQGDAATQIVAGAMINNTGLLVASNSINAAGTLNTLALNNSGTLRSSQDLNINVLNTVENSGLLLAGRDLAVRGLQAATTLNVTNKTNGTLQAGNTLAISGQYGGTNANLTTQLNSVIYAGLLDVDVNALTNNALIQANSAGSDITVVDTLSNNSGAKIVFTGNTGSINASKLNNSGTVQSEGDININIGSQLNNDATGQLIVKNNNDLIINGATATTYTVSNNGIVDASGKLEIKGVGVSRNVDITQSNTGVMRAGTMSMTANNIVVNNGAQLISNAGSLFNVNFLTMQGSTSRLINKTGNSTINIANDFTNNGALHSAGHLNISAANVTNSATAGMSALGNLAVTATSSDLINNGAFYSQGSMTLSSGNRLTNSVTGTIDSGATITATADTFTNNNAIVSQGNITINATHFVNKIGHDVTREWVDTYSAETATSYYSVKWLTTDSWCTDILDCNRVEQGYERTWTHQQQFVSGLKPSDISITPQILALNSTLLIQGKAAGTGFTTGANVGGLLSANTVRLTGNGVSATFINDDLSLITETYNQTRNKIDEWQGVVGAAVHHDRGYSGWSTGSPISSSSNGSFVAGIHANGGTLYMTGFQLSNNGAAFAPLPATQADKNAILTADNTALTVGNDVNSTAITTVGSAVSGASATNNSNTASTTGTSGTSNGETAQINGGSSAVGSAAITFAGLNITVPTNPNGYFIVSQNPASNYLIETNPLFQVGGTFNGSNYLAERYGYNPDHIQKRLGDANYEAFLIRQQLIQQTGNNLLAGYHSEEELMLVMMDKGADEAKRLGLAWGQSPSAAQLDNLNEDIVWMVEVTVQGQKVLAPQVFLSKDTKASIQKGAVIAGTNVKMDLLGVTNTGGVISASNNLDITSAADFVNTSGTVTGYNVSVVSTQGSIINKTATLAGGDEQSYNTVIGKTAGITATNQLSLDAKKDITVIGANVNAGGDASISAGNNITFDTIVDKKASTSYSESGNGLVNNKTSTTTTTETNIGSNLGVGGNLTLKSGNDTTIAGSHAAVGGNLAVDTGGDFNVIARQDKVTTHTESTTSGLGVGGGVGGVEKVTTDDFKGTNVASTLTVGGNAAINSAGAMVLQGSDATIAGNADINAKEGISVLDGLNEQRTTTVTETTTYLKSGGTASSGSGSSSSSSSVPLKAEAKAEASAEAESDHDFRLVETTVSVTDTTIKNSVASNLNVGGNLTAKTDGDITIQGSNLDVQGNGSLDAKNVNVLAGRNESTTTNTTSVTSVGFYEESNAKAEAQASAEAQAYGPLATNANASAGASASADSTVTIGVQQEDSQSLDYTLTNTASTIKIGGDLSIKAAETAKFVGAEVESGGNMSIEATDIRNESAKDISLSVSNKDTNLAGLYVGADANAEASVESNAQTGLVTGVDGSAQASAEAEASAGLRYKNTSENSVSGSVTNQTNSFKSGGDFTRTASNTIVDQGTSIDAGGDFTQSAREIRDEAIHDQTFSSSDKASHDARIGVYAGASAEAGADVGASTVGMAGASAGAGAEASIGVKAQYDYEGSSESQTNNTAVTSRFRAGGNINSTSTEKTSLVGTQFESGGDINIAAGSLDYQAAQDSSTSTNSSTQGSAELKVGILGVPGVNADASYNNGDNGEASTTARAGSMNAAGNLNIKTTGDATFVGTNLTAGNAASIDAGGDVDFQAARNTTTTSSAAQNAQASLSVSAKEQGGSVGGGFENADSATSTAVVGGIKSGAGGTAIKSGGNTTLEGTQLASAGSTSIAAGGDVNLKAAVSTTSSSSNGFTAEVGMDKGGSPEGEIGGGFTDAGSKSSTTAGIQSAGGISISGKTITNQEASLDAGAGKLTTSGTVINTEAENSEYATGVEARVKFGGGGDTKKGGGDSTSPNANTAGNDSNNSNTNNASNNRPNDSSSSSSANKPNSTDNNPAKNPNTDSKDTNTADASDNNSNEVASTGGADEAKDTDTSSSSSTDLNPNVESEAKSSDDNNADEVASTGSTDEAKDTDTSSLSSTESNPNAESEAKSSDDNNTDEVASTGGADEAKDTDTSSSSSTESNPNAESEAKSSDDNNTDEVASTGSTDEAKDTDTSSSSSTDLNPNVESEAKSSDDNNTDGEAPAPAVADKSDNTEAPAHAPTPASDEVASTGGADEAKDTDTSSSSSTESNPNTESEAKSSDDNNADEVASTGGTDEAKDTDTSSSSSTESNPNAESEAKSSDDNNADEVASTGGADEAKDTDTSSSSSTDSNPNTESEAKSADDNNTDEVASAAKSDDGEAEPSDASSSDESDDESVSSNDAEAPASVPTVAEVRDTKVTVGSYAARVGVDIDVEELEEEEAPSEMVTISAQQKIVDKHVADLNSKTAELKALNEKIAKLPADSEESKKLAILAEQKQAEINSISRALKSESAKLEDISESKEADQM